MRTRFECLTCLRCPDEMAHEKLFPRPVTGALQSRDLVRAENFIVNRSQLAFPGRKKVLASAIFVRSFHPKVCHSLSMEVPVYNTPSPIL